MSVESSFQQLIGRVRERAPRTRIFGPDGLGLAHVVLEAARVRPVLVVAQSRVAADDLRRDLHFLAGGHAAEILTLPADERTPYHAASPDPLAVMERTATLYKLATGAPARVVVASPEAVVRRQLPFAALQRMGEWVCAGSEIDRDQLVAKLGAGGYTRVNTVEDPGSFAVRGSIIDVFWAGMPRPVRIDLFGDEVETLKLFDPSTQLTVDQIEEVSLGPAREVHLDEETVARAKKALRDLGDEVEFPTKKLRELLGDLDARLPFFGIEALLPALHGSLGSIFELLDQGLGADGYTVVVEDPAALARARSETEGDLVSHHRAALSRGALCYPPSAFVLDEDTLDAALDKHARVEVGGLQVEGEAADDASRIELRLEATRDLRQRILRESVRRDDETGHHLLDPLVATLRDLKQRGRAVLLPASSRGGVDRLVEMLRPHGLQVRARKEPPDLDDAATRKALHDPAVHAWSWVARPAPARGGDLPHLGLTVIAEDEIFGKKARRSTSGSGKRKGFKTTLSDLEPDDHIVHVEHGVGIFKGLTRLNVRGVEQDFVQLEYAGKDKLYLPVHRINLIQRYTGPGGRPPRVDKLGGTGWQTTRKKVKKAVLAMAQELLDLYAKRELARRDAAPAPDEAYWEFEAAFPFETTPDQQKAIDEVLADLQSDRPMDRLICGDVGYGKTEVGMRGAMLTVLAKRQVAVLAPTTVLAQQHLLTFQERFKDTGAVVEAISRFRSSKEVKDILKRTAEGKVDVLIGTHRLLSNDVSFKNLGLVVVDEEQRFGVKAKEKLKRFRAKADVLTLSATPIPRTLQMGFFGIRDLSVIETPPVDRRAIRTSIIRFDDEVIREAMMRELSRGGQCYFVHNRVRSIGAVSEYLTRLVPEARVGVAHGQMEEKQLEDVMIKFLSRDLNVLLCTAIIETGIDVSSANTMFIDHADDFGLAQLYQLRGRVGRSKDRAFAYLIIPTSTEHLTPDARKRLEVLQRFSELGDGFKVAQHDLELRGAGDMLGKGQHGHVTAVGYDLYSELLKEAVEELKGKHHTDIPDPDINLPVAAFVPEKFVPDLHERLAIYQRLASTDDSKDVYDVIGEVADRYGDPPAEVTALADVMILKQRLRQLFARSLDLGGGHQARKAEAEAAASDGPPPPPKIVVALGESNPLDAGKLATFTGENASRYQLTPQMKLVFTPSEAEWKACGHELLAMCRTALRQVAEAVT